jgi:phospholipase/carboxylesterase
MHPLIPFEPEDQKGLTGKRILITAGRRDPICPPSLTERLETYFVGQGAEVSAFWHDGGHEIRQAELQAAAPFLRAAG